MLVKSNLIFSLTAISLFLFTEIGCSTDTKPPPITSSLTPLPTATGTNVIIPTLVPTLAPITPEIVKLCPDSREIPFDELPIPENIRLVVKKDEYADDVWPVSRTGDELEPLPTVNLGNSWGRSFQGFSPDGEWLLWILHKPGSMEELSGGSNNSLWMVSIDGNEVQEIVTLENYYIYQVYASWRSENEISISSYLGELFDSYIWNIKTQELDPYEKVHPKSFYEVNRFSHQEIDYVLYYRQNPNGTESSYYLINMDTGEDEKVLHWLPKDGPFTSIDYFLLSRISFYGDGTFAIVIVKPYGFDYVGGLEFDDLFKFYHY